MDDQYVSRALMTAIAAWTTVLLLMVFAWVIALNDPSRQWLIVGGLMAASACSLSAVAAVLSIRRYASRICRLIRNLHGVDAGDREGLRVLR